MAGYSVKSKQYRHRLGCFKGGIGENIEEFGVHFIGFEFVLNIDDGNGRDRGEQTGLIPEKTSLTHHGRSGCEKGTHKHQHDAQAS